MTAHKRSERTKELDKEDPIAFEETTQAILYEGGAIKTEGELSFDIEKLEFKDAEPKYSMNYMDVATVDGDACAVKFTELKTSVDSLDPKSSINCCSEFNLKGG